MHDNANPNVNGIERGANDVTTWNPKCAVSEGLKVQGLVFPLAVHDCMHDEVTPNVNGIKRGAHDVTTWNPKCARRE